MNQKSGRRARLIILMVFIGCLWSLALARGGQNEKDAEVEILIAQAESASQKGNYSQAIDNYLQASKLAKSRINLSRAYLGLAISYFYVRDLPGSKMWVREVLKVDPNKEVSNLFYPDSFVQLFAQTRAEMERAKTAGGSELPKPDVAREELEAPRQQPEATKNEPPLLQTQEAEAPRMNWSGLSGKFEIDVHVSSWSINPIKWAFESSVTDELGKGIRKEMSNQIKRSHASLTNSSYEETLAFDSSGSNYGLELRYYPGGRKGFFSLGLSFEKTKLRLQVKGPVKQNYTNGSSATVDSEAYLETSPFTTNLSFRWDFLPSRRVCPYFVLGFGVGALSGTVGYTYNGTYSWSGYQESVTGSKVESFDEAEKAEDVTFNIPEVILLFQLNFGLKAEIYKGLTLKAEAGIWDGLILRGALAFRF
jgi:hypothetical protein